MYVHGGFVYCDICCREVAHDEVRIVEDVPARPQAERWKRALG